MQDHLDFTAALRARCQLTPGRLALPDSDDARVVEVAQRLLGENSAAAVSFYVAKDKVEAIARSSSIDLSLFGNRVQSRDTPPDASPGERLKLAATDLAAGEVDAVLGGNIATTADVIRAGLKQVGLAPGVRTVSGAFIMHRPPSEHHPETTYLFADCSVVITPTLSQLVDIAEGSVATWRQLMPSVPPVVAFLSFSTKGSANHPAAALMAEAAALFKAQSPAIISDGELQFDAAFDAAIGLRKAPGSLVPGLANCLIFPDLNAGNIGYKLTQRLGGFEAYGPVLQGLAKSMNDLSRGATVQDILSSAYITLSRAVRGA